MGLFAALDEFGDAIEADFQREYNLDLVDFYRGELSPRKVWALIERLPHDSETATAMNGGTPVLGPAENLLADLWALLVRVNSGPKASPVDHPARKAIADRAKAARRAESQREYERQKAEDMKRYGRQKV